MQQIKPIPLRTPDIGNFERMGIGGCHEADFLFLFLLLFFNQKVCYEGVVDVAGELLLEVSSDRCFTYPQPDVQVLTRKLLRGLNKINAS